MLSKQSTHTKFPNRARLYIGAARKSDTLQSLARMRDAHLCVNIAVTALLLEKISA